MAQQTVIHGIDDARRRWLIGGGAAAVVVVIVLAWVVVHMMRGGEPRLNDRTPVLGKFVATGAFERLPYDKQRQYYKILDDRGKEIDQAFAEGELSHAQYQAALDAAWLGKHINRSEKYAALPPGKARSEYIDELLVKKAKKDAKKPDAADSADEFDADEMAAELRVESWPAQARQQWQLFHDAYRREKKTREEPPSPTGTR